MTLLMTLLTGLPLILGLLLGIYLAIWWPLLLYGAMSVASFAAYGLDKRRARLAVGLAAAVVTQGRPHGRNFSYLFLSQESKHEHQGGVCLLWVQPGQ